MTYNVFGGTLNPILLILLQFAFEYKQYCLLLYYCKLFKFEKGAVLSVIKHHIFFIIYYIALQV